MTAAHLRSLTTAGAVLPCSPVRLVTPDGTVYEIDAKRLDCKTHTTDDGRELPAGVPVLTLFIRRAVA